MDVLVVEDDAQLSELLEAVFREEGHVPVLCATIRAALRALGAQRFDLVVLDRMLPDGDGLALCDRVRERSADTPVIVLTALGEVPDRIGGLRAGVDDYVTKPFDVEELLLRVDAVCRRAHHGWVVAAGPLTLDHRARLVRADDRKLDLTAREFALLARLVASADTCVPRATLLADVWGMAFDPGTNVIDFHVSKLRDKLGDFAWVVETVRGRGLRFRTKP